ncbi:hypothetical protein DPMN_007252 [Dreissena polymorpha]|uniref:Uncharacterized protein n=1 Tax=Dreissena polymorpha TaxID=45954 RepID=A0A9D4MVV6_DREPO|nr:hypothetical protein DPMN_007252 [Dreissena polymorpha]
MLELVNVIGEYQVREWSAFDGDVVEVSLEGFLQSFLYLLNSNVKQDGRKQTFLTEAS